MNLLNTIIYLLVIPASVYVLVRKLDMRFQVNGNRVLLIAACLVFIAALFVPSPQINGQDTQFFTHVLGGIFVGMLWLYFRPATKAVAWYWEFIILFAVTSSLGVLNELYELFAYELRITRVPVTDTSWDLLANTLGAMLFYGAYQMRNALRKLFFSR